MEENYIKYSKRRMKCIDSLVNQSVSNIINPKLEEKLNKKKINPKNISENLKEIIQNSFYDEKEIKIQEMIDEIELKVTEKNKFQIKFDEIKKKNEIKRALLEDQNILLRQRYEKVFETSNISKEKTNSILQNTETFFSKQETSFEEHKDILIKAKESCIEMRQELSGFKVLITKNMMKQKKVFSLVKTTILQQTKLPLNESNDIKEMKTKLIDLNQENKELKSIYSNLIQILSETNSKAFIVQNNKTLQSSIRNIPIKAKKEEIENIKKELFKEFSHSKNCLKNKDLVTVMNVLKDRNRIKNEEEYKTQIIKLKNEEKQLNKQLKNAESHSKVKQIIDMDLEEKDFNWEESKRILDMKISELDSSTSLSLRKTPSYL